VSGYSRPAGREESAGLWPAVRAARLFEDAAALAAWGEAAPWRVRVTAAGDAAVLGRWREHLPVLAVRGVWCPDPRLPPLMIDLADVAREQGFERLLGPLVPEEAVGPYQAAGMDVAHRIVVCRQRIPRSQAADPQRGVFIRGGTAADEEAVLAVDAATFDDFWRYDRPGMRELMAAERLAVAEESGGIIGYTLCTIHGTEATIARLAVLPAAQGRGVGRALLREALAHLAGNGARAVTLCTQEENRASRRLYLREGFSESPGLLVSAMTPR
jgi:ribosomal protein S18 acetylase RimI-like enzyme